MTRPAADYLEVVPLLRQSHIERHTPGVRLVGWRAEAGLRADRLPPDVAVVGRLRLAFEIAAAPPHVLELPEPLWLRAWPTALLLGVTARLSARLRGRRVRVGSYAIENLPVADALSLRRLGIPTDRGDGLLRRLLGRSLAVLDAVAFGSPGARDNYLGAWPGITSRLIPERLSPCTCPAADTPPAGAVFVGEFTGRKGICDLMSAWDLIGTEARGGLQLVGRGELLGRVQEWAAGHPGVRLTIDPPREEIHRAYRSAAVVVLPSRRVVGWREQIGLPLLEARAHGRRIIATSETGLAQELAAAGHAVVPPGDPHALARALMTALSQPEQADGWPAGPGPDSRGEVQQWLRNG